MAPTVALAAWLVVGQLRERDDESDIRSVLKAVTGVRERHEGSLRPTSSTVWTVPGHGRGGARPGVAGRRDGHRAGPGPVSYTHLDVYKRQPYSCCVPGMKPGTVSYTHLDVYKRQRLVLVHTNQSLDRPKCLLLLALTILF